MTKMTVDDFVKSLEEAIEENKNIDDGELGLIYCDDTECIEAHKAVLNQCVNEYEQLIGYLKLLKKVKMMIEFYYNNSCTYEEACWTLDDIKYLLEDVK